MDQWLDSLSEDWVSQPRSSPSAFLPTGTPSASGDSSVATNHSQSRIPRYKTQQGSIPSKETQYLRSTESSANLSKGSKILRERSLSNANLPSKAPKKGTSNVESPSGPPARGRRISRPLSGSKATPVEQLDTVQYKSLSSSPLKVRQSHQTPDWKRRLLGKDIKYGRELDLFSPIALENMFRPPPSQPMEVQLKREGRGQTKDIGLRSSPPPYLSTGGGNSPVSFTSDSKQRMHSGSKSLDGKADGKQGEGRKGSGKMKSRRIESEKITDSVLEENICNSSNSDLSNTATEMVVGSQNNVYTGIISVSGMRIMSGNRFVSLTANGISQDVSSSQHRLIENRDAGNRTVSRQDVARNEEISPIFVTRHNTVNGLINYEVLNESAQRRCNELHDLVQNEDQGEGSDLDQQQKHDSQKISDTCSSPHASLPRTWTSSSLPHDLSTGTQGFASNGGFVNFRRRGCSNEGFFERGNLSSSSLPLLAESDHARDISRTEEVWHISPQLRPMQIASEREDAVPPAAPTPPAIPQTPTRSSMRRVSTPEISKSSGSPLKLFGGYDTFTNERLLRRMSQFEDSLYNEDEDFSRTDNHEPRPKEERGEQEHVSEMEEFSMHMTPTTQNPARYALGQRLSPRSTQRCSFGRGELDNYEFREEDSDGSPRSRSFDANILDQSPLSQLRSGWQTRIEFPIPPRATVDADTARYHQSFKEFREISHLTKRRTFDNGKLGHRQPAKEIEDNQRSMLVGPSENKRSPPSPFKNPTPKRRRTLCRSEFETVGIRQQSFESIRVEHQEMQSTTDRGAQGALCDMNDQAANPEILAMRQMLRPRTPTPNQMRMEDGRSSHGKPHTQHMRNPRIHNTIAPEVTLEAQAEIVAEELASFGVDVGKHMLDESRRGSVTTQDFLDEAVKIMNFIRAKGRPDSGSGSIEESESESADPLGGSTSVVHSDDMSSVEEFSRPPSREGVSVAKARSCKSQDPRVLSHLRKFEEKEELDILVTSSLNRLSVSENPPKGIEAAMPLSSTESYEMESNQSNIRITENPNVKRKRRNSDFWAHEPTIEIPECHVSSHGSHPSSHSSSSRTVQTGSSTSTTTKHVIGPDRVSHLIPEQIAGMTYDRDRQIWIKRKTVSIEIQTKGEKSMSEETDDDPFGEIPDLSVDELEELQRVQVVAAERRDEELAVNSVEAREQLHYEELTVKHGDVNESIAVIRPHVGSDFGSNQIHRSSAPSESSRLASNGLRTETRATSWGEDDGTVKQPRQQQTEAELGGEIPNTNNDVEHEIKIHEDRIAATHNRPGAVQGTREVTFSISSPLMTSMQRLDINCSHGLGPETWTDASELNPGGSAIEETHDLDHSTCSQHSTLRRASTRVTSKSVYRGAARRVSFGSHSFTARPVSRIKEQSEDSFCQNHGGARTTSFDVTISTPLPLRGVPNSDLLPLSPPSGRRTNMSFHLSPLPDFTVNQKDESLCLEVDHLASRRGQFSRREVETSISLAAKDLVKKLTDVEPYEPYWDYLRQLDLKGKGLVTLHMLNEFCGRIEYLDVSENEIGQLSGVPYTVRSLRIQSNCLSNLTAWGHLRNLQYLDVSGNQIESLEGFRDLVHLRELRADNNSISSLEGVMDLDGLTLLRVRGNRLEEVDFEATEMKRLSDLDLSGNVLIEVLNLDNLPALVQLNLDDNRLAGFHVSASTPLSQLKSLRLAKNHLSDLDVSSFPALRELHLDGNQITKVDGLQKAKLLKTLSMQDQINESDISHGASIDDCFELRELHLSQSTVFRITPKLDFLNLQQLELATAGLDMLPSNFGQKMVNVRVLNLNFNALKDVRPLLGILRLEKLLLAGNRLSRLRRTTLALSRFGSLTELDLRGNPLTVGFYPPLMEKRIVVHRKSLIDDEDDMIEPFTLPRAENENDKVYYERLDGDTKLRRRVYEMMLASGCTNVKVLDGLGFGDVDVGMRDGVWERLCGLGVVGKAIGYGN
ncbi:MAG: hypothetical protein M1827_002531 [Pycnora praestabilis]|nr:MAG: hypothetical protein M1827_002531 [Pycnora praestabilis]